MLSRYDRWALQTPEEAAGLNYECRECGELMQRGDYEDHKCPPEETPVPEVWEDDEDVED